jgi:aspartate/methionine/tyrosine aminotransferase
MNFTAFQLCRESLLRNQPSLIDCSASNLYAALQTFLLRLDSEEFLVAVHRCDPANAWTQQFDLPAQAASRALVSGGVRDSLTLLFGWLATRNALLWLPEDNYPVYNELARQGGLTVMTFPTLPEPLLPGQPCRNDIEVLLLTNPLKPLGRWLNDNEVEQLERWLAADCRRRLWIDAVYTWDCRFHDSTLRLLATGQTLLMHSLTKGWLQPRLFGVALVPEVDFVTLAPWFRAHPPTAGQLAIAQRLLRDHAALPGAVGAELQVRRQRLLAALPCDIELLSSLNAPGYFVPVRRHWKALLDLQGLLGLPASVFGSGRQDITILSSLGFIS